MDDTIISYNKNGWMPISELSYADKDEIFGQYICNTYAGRLPAVIGLQESIAGKEGIYLTGLKKALGDEYIILTPPDFDYLKHYRSIMNITLVRKDLMIKQVRQIGDVLPNRIFCVTVLIHNQPVHFVNYYAVQIQNFTGKAAWYVEDRKSKHEELWEELLRAADYLNLENTVILGDFQEDTKRGNHIHKLIGLGYREKVSGFPTVRNDFFTETSIDHIFYSRTAYELFNHSSFALDGALLGEVSDHSMLAASSALMEGLRWCT